MQTPPHVTHGVPMYTLAVRREFIARHFLIGGDWGRENFPNSHRYALELQLGGQELDKHGYLVDIVEVERHLAELIEYYSEKMLNDLPEFTDLNPSLEHFARILAISLSQRIKAQSITSLKVILWEHESAWAAYSLDRSAK
jgi:6-pyruvoyltetrahydropterin/6-carboxytetrahydropterin synthase